MPTRQTEVLEDVRLVFRNFAGKEGQYNREGDRNFAVILDEEQERRLLMGGWNVKYLKAREEEGETPQAYIQVSVNFNGPRPPQVVMITSRGRQTLPEAQVEILDWVDIEHVDLILNPYDWAVSGKTGRKAYLASIYVTIVEDYLQQKYADVSEIGTSEEVLELESAPAAIKMTASRDDR